MSDSFIDEILRDSRTIINVHGTVGNPLHFHVFVSRVIMATMGPRVSFAAMGNTSIEHFLQLSETRVEEQVVEDVVPIFGTSSNAEQALSLLNCRLSQCPGDKDHLSKIIITVQQLIVDYVRKHLQDVKAIQQKHDGSSNEKVQLSSARMQIEVIVGLCGQFTALCTLMSIITGQSNEKRLQDEVSRDALYEQGTQSLHGLAADKALTIVEWLLELRMVPSEPSNEVAEEVKNLLKHMNMRSTSFRASVKAWLVGRGLMEYGSDPYGLEQEIHRLLVEDDPVEGLVSVIPTLEKSTAIPLLKVCVVGVKDRLESVVRNALQSTTGPMFSKSYMSLAVPTNATVATLEALRSSLLSLWLLGEEDFVREFCDSSKVDHVNVEAHITWRLCLVYLEACTTYEQSILLLQWVKKRFQSDIHHASKFLKCLKPLVGSPLDSFETSNAPSRIMADLPTFKAALRFFDAMPSITKLQTSKELFPTTTAPTAPSRDATTAAFLSLPFTKKSSAEAASLFLEVFGPHEASLDALFDTKTVATIKANRCFVTARHGLSLALSWIADNQWYHRVPDWVVFAKSMIDFGPSAQESRVREALWAIINGPVFVKLPPPEQEAIKKELQLQVETPDSATKATFTSTGASQEPPQNGATSILDSLLSMPSSTMTSRSAMKGLKALTGNDLPPAQAATNQALLATLIFNVPPPASLDEEQESLLKKWCFSRCLSLGGTYVTLAKSLPPLTDTVMSRWVAGFQEAVRTLPTTQLPSLFFSLSFVSEFGHLIDAAALAREALDVILTRIRQDENTTVQREIAIQLSPGSVGARKPLVECIRAAGPGEEDFVTEQILKSSNTILLLPLLAIAAELKMPPKLVISALEKEPLYGAPRYFNPNSGTSHLSNESVWKKLVTVYGKGPWTASIASELTKTLELRCQQIACRLAENAVEDDERQGLTASLEEHLVIAKLTIISDDIVCALTSAFGSLQKMITITQMLLNCAGKHSGVSSNGLATLAERIGVFLQQFPNEECRQFTNLTQSSLDAIQKLVEEHAPSKRSNFVDEVQRLSFGCFLYSQPSKLRTAFAVRPGAVSPIAKVCTQIDAMLGSFASSHIVLINSSCGCKAGGYVRKGKATKKRITVSKVVSTQDPTSEEGTVGDLVAYDEMYEDEEEEEARAKTTADEDGDEDESKDTPENKAVILGVTSSVVESCCKELIAGLSSLCDDSTAIAHGVDLVEEFMMSVLSKVSVGGDAERKKLVLALAALRNVQPRSIYLDIMLCKGIGNTTPQKAVQDITQAPEDKSKIRRAVAKDGDVQEVQGPTPTLRYRRLLALIVEKSIPNARLFENVRCFAEILSLLVSKESVKLVAAEPLKSEREEIHQRARSLQYIPVETEIDVPFDEFIAEIARKLRLGLVQWLGRALGVGDGTAQVLVNKNFAKTVLFRVGSMITSFGNATSAKRAMRFGISRSPLTPAKEEAAQSTDYNSLIKAELQQPSVLMFLMECFHMYRRLLDEASLQSCVWSKYPLGSAKDLRERSGIAQYVVENGFVDFNNFRIDSEAASAGLISILSSANRHFQRRGDQAVLEHRLRLVQVNDSGDTYLPWDVCREICTFTHNAIPSHSARMKNFVLMRGGNEVADE